MTIHDLEQGTTEWLSVRLGKFTASTATPVGANGKGLETLAKDKAIELLAGLPDVYTNARMDWGNEQEPNARKAYEIETMSIVQEVGFVEMDENVGCSPDGLVGDNGGIEIKCRSNKAYFDFLMSKKVPASAMNQIQFTLWVTGRKWWDYVEYNPNFKKSICIVRVEPNDEYFKKLQEGVKRGVELRDEYISKYNDL
jgi:hypothetical protein